MSCNGCRVLRKACVENCILRSALQWIPTPEAQGYATLFLAKFFGRSYFLALIATVPPSQRSTMFLSLLFEACGRTINPVTGAVGLLTTGNWQVCQAAVSTVLCGGTLEPLPAGRNEIAGQPFNTARDQFCKQYPHDLVGASTHTSPQTNHAAAASSFTVNYWPELKNASSYCSEMSSEMVKVESSDLDGTSNGEGGTQDEIKLLNLFV